VFSQTELPPYLIGSVGGIGMAGDDPGKMLQARGRPMEKVIAEGAAIDPEPFPPGPEDKLVEAADFLSEGKESQ
jgi:hypothetical protein